MNKMLKFSGVNLNVKYNKEKSKDSTNAIINACMSAYEFDYIDKIIQTIEGLSPSNHNFLNNINTNLTGVSLINEEKQLKDDTWEEARDLMNLINILDTYEALQSDDPELIKEALKKILKVFDPQFKGENSDALVEEYISKLSKEEMVAYLQNYLDEKVSNSRFINRVLTEKFEADSRKSSSSYGGGGYSASPASMPTVKALTSEDLKDETKPKEETIKPAEIQEVNKDILKSEDIKKEETTTETKENKDIENDFLNSSITKQKENQSTNSGITNSNSSSIASSGKSLATSVGGAAENGIETVKDLIANAGKLKGALSSSVTSIADNTLKTIKPLVKNVSENVGNSSAVLPGIAGISTAALAGAGTKLYIDKKENEENEEDDNEEHNKFFDLPDEDDDEQDTIDDALSKEDLMKMLENKF